MVLCTNTSGAVYCNRSCLFVCLCVCGFVGLLPQPEIACIDLHQTGSVGEDSDCLHLIKFWPVLRPRKGSAWGENRRRFTTASLPARSVCERFFIYFLKSEKNKSNLYTVVVVSEALGTRTQTCTTCPELLPDDVAVGNKKEETATCRRQVQRPKHYATQPQSSAARHRVHWSGLLL